METVCFPWELKQLHGKSNVSHGKIAAFHGNLIMGFHGSHGIFGLGHPG
jgi:hypothetical protein